MKHYIIPISALLLSICLFFQNTTSAASITPSPSVSPTNGRAILVNQYIVDYEDDNGQPYPVGNECIAVYELTLSPFLNFTGDGYITGAGTYSLSINPTTPSGWTYYAVEKDYTGYNDTYLMACTYSYGQNTNSMQIGVYANNVPINYGWVGLGTVTIRMSFSYTAPVTSVPDPDPYITYTATMSSNSGNYTLNTNPSDVAMYSIIENAIVQALSDARVQNQDIDTIIDTLDSISQTIDEIRDQDYTTYTNVLSALNVNNQWLQMLHDSIDDIYAEIILLYRAVDSIDTTASTISSNVTTIKSYLNSIKSYTSSLKTYMSTFPSYSAQVLVYLGQLTEMNATQATEAAVIESEYADVQNRQESMNAVVSSVTKPYIGSNMDIENYLDSTQRNSFNGLLGLIVGNNYITKLFIIVISFATAGFILYGRKE